MLEKLANRAAILTFLSAFFFVVGLVTASRALSSGSGFARGLAVVPLALAAALAAWTWRTRAELRRVREREARQQEIGGAIPAPHRERGGPRPTVPSRTGPVRARRPRSG